MGVAFPEVLKSIGPGLGQPARGRLVLILGIGEAEVVHLLENWKGTRGLVLPPTWPSPKAPELSGPKEAGYMLICSLLGTS